MGRALKIQKNNVGAGTTVSGSNPVVTTYNQTVLTDAGFPNFGSLTNPAYNTPVQTLDSTQFLGVVGGSPATSTASATFPEIAALVNILLADGTDTGSGAGRIIRQKGSHKFLVAATASQISAGSFIVGQAYQIVDPSDTPWNAIGGEATAVAGDIFTATGVGSGSGTAYAVGVTDITFLNYVDGHLEATLKLRKDIVRQIRISQPDRLVCQSPERNWERIGASHPDHLAAGEASIQAVYPDARNPFAFTDLLNDEGLKPWRVKEVWMMGFANPDHFVDITDTFDLKMKALHSHVSQTAHNTELENMVREWGQRNAGVAGFAKGRIAEAFKIINTN